MKEELKNNSCSVFQGKTGEVKTSYTMTLLPWMVCYDKLQLYH